MIAFHMHNHIASSRVWVHDTVIVNTKWYIQIYDTITKGLLLNPWQQPQKLVKTILYGVISVGQSSGTAT